MAARLSESEKEQRRAIRDARSIIQQAEKSDVNETGPQAQRPSERRGRVRSCLLVVLLIALPTPTLAQALKCLPLPPVNSSEDSPPLTPQLVKVSKWKSEPGEFRIYSNVRSPDGQVLSAPVMILTNPDCLQVPVMDDAIWLPKRGTITFWPESARPIECTVRCMGGR